jgi:hypothetical protein
MTVPFAMAKALQRQWGTLLFREDGSVGVRFHQRPVSYFGMPFSLAGWPTSFGGRFRPPSTPPWTSWSSLTSMVEWPAISAPRSPTTVSARPCILVVVRELRLPGRGAAKEVVPTGLRSPAPQRLVLHCVCLVGRGYRTRCGCAFKGLPALWRPKQAPASVPWGVRPREPHRLHGRHRRGLWEASHGVPEGV